MIIKCNNCNKKFEVNSSLIPVKGRNINCGSCGHEWFFNPSLKASPEKFVEKSITEKFPKSKIIEENESFINNEVQSKKILVKQLVNEEISNENDNGEILVTTNKASRNFNLSKILSYLIVLIVSFTALIIILDTFKSPLSNVFPSLELLLYNLFESIKDIFLFINDLLI